VVLYDTAAGDTHLITFNASQILQQILEQPSTLSELAASIVADAESADDLLVELVSVVNALHKLGLIEPGAS
jgi:PqqD family protein of HPr-rel-A system